MPCFTGSINDLTQLFFVVLLCYIDITSILYFDIIVLTFALKKHGAILSLALSTVGKCRSLQLEVSLARLIHSSNM